MESFTRLVDCEAFCFIIQDFDRERFDTDHQIIDEFGMALD